MKKKTNDIHSEDCTCLISQETPFEQLIRYLLLNYKFLNDIGLLNGQMGGVLFFNHYAKYSGNDLYIQYAEALFQELNQNIHKGTPVELESGLCGIGWGIEYLSQNGFIQINTDEFLDEVDNRIMNTDPAKIQGLSIYTGLGGILLYVLTRLSSFERNGPLPFGQTYLNDLHITVCQTSLKEIEYCAGWVEDFDRIIRSGEIPYGKYKTIPECFWGTMPGSDNPSGQMPIGIKNGITGIAIQRILQTQ